MRTLDGVGERLAAAGWRDLFGLAAIAAVVGIVAGIAGVYPLAFVAGLAPLAVVAARDLRAATVLIALSSPIVAVGSVSVGFHLLPCYVFVLAALAGVAWRRELSSLEPRAYDWLLLAFLVVACTVTVANLGTVPATTVIAATGANGPHLRSLAQLAAVVLMAGLYLVVRIAARDRERVDALIRALLVATAFVALYAAYQAIGRKLGLPYTHVNERRAIAATSPDAYLRVNSTLPEASPLAEFTIAGLFLALAWIRAPAARPAWMPATAARALLAGCAAVVAATLSIAAWVSCLVWAPLVLVFARREGRRRVALAAGSVLLALLLAVVLVRSDGAGVSGTYDSQRYVRVGYWIAGAQAALHHPFGVGVGNFPFYYPLYAPLSGNYEYHIAISDSHNLFLDAAAETGVIGLMLLVGFFATLVYSGIRSVASAHSSADDRVRDVGLALAAALGAGILMHLTFSYAYYPFEWVIAALVGSLPRVVARRAAGAAP